ncbi:serine-arginine protein 55-like [Scylla paramamosain]
MMSKLYVGNLPTDVNEGTLRQLFSEQGVSATNVLVKRGGYAFVDCQDQTGIDRAIQELNGYSFMGHSIVVEPSVAGGGAKRTV